MISVFHIVKKLMEIPKIDGNPLIDLALWQNFCYVLKTLNDQ